MAQQALVDQGLVIVEASRWRTFSHTTIPRAILDERSARSRDLYLTTHSTHNRHPSMFPVVFESTLSANERLQNLALDRMATGIGTGVYTSQKTQFMSIRKKNDILGTDQDPLRPLMLNKNALCFITLSLYQGADKSLAWRTSRFILFDGENILFDASC
jgi:hypothetical protein